jgi:CBS domain containing-hemolysin-like protein
MMQMIMAKGHSRIPVHAGSVTNIVGLVLVGHLSFSPAIRNSSYSLGCGITSKQGIA